MSRAPFVGLRPFELDDSELFYGRDKQTRELLDRLERQCFVSVVGLSGSGKSSLVKAGLIPALYRGELRGGPTHWTIVEIRPNDDSPVDTLAAKLGTPGARQILQDSSLGLAKWCQANLEKQVRLLVFADQFEEIFRDGQEEQSEQDLAFVRLLIESARPGGQVIVVLTIRADFLGYCGRFRGLPEAMNQSQYLIPRLSRDEMRETIVGPIRAAGAGISDGLVCQIMNDAGDDPTQLPLLQHALLRLWDESQGDRANGLEINADHYKNIGYLDNALDQHAGQIFGKYEKRPEKERITKVLFQRITERKEDGQLTRRRTKLSKIFDVTAKAPGEAKTSRHQELVREIIEDFRAEGVTFLSPRLPEKLTQDSIIDLSHESLARRWTQLGKWISVEAEAARLFRRFKQDLADGKECYWGRDLAIADAWAEGEPSDAWAERYGGGLQGVLAFVEKSRQETLRDEETKREASLKVEHLKWKADSEKYKRIIAVLTAAVFLALAFFAREQRQQARASSALALSRLLANESQTMIEKGRGPTLAALLAIESLKREQTQVNSGSLRDSISLIRQAIDLPKLSGIITALAISSDSSLLAATGRAPAGQELQIATLAPKPAVVLKTVLPVTQPVNEVIFSPDKSLVAARTVKNILLIEIPSGNIRLNIEATSERGSMRLGDGLLTYYSGQGDTEFTLHGYAAETAGKPAQSANRQKELWNDRLGGICALSGNGRVVAKMSSEGAIQLLRVSKSSGLRVFQVIEPVKDEKIDDLWLSADGGRLLTLAGEHFRIWSTAGGTVAGSSSSVKIPNPFKEPKAVFGGDQVILWSDAKIEAFDAKGETSWELHSDIKNLPSEQISSSGNEIALVAGNVVKYVVSGEERARLEPNFRVTAASISRDGRYVGVGGREGHLQFIATVADERVVKTLALQQGEEIVSASGTWALTKGTGTMRLLELPSGKEISRLAVEPGAKEMLSVSRNGRWMALALKGEAYFLDTTTGSIAGPKKLLVSPKSIFIANDGKRFAAVRSQDVALFDPSAWDKPSTITPPLQQVVVSTAFSPDGRWMMLRHRMRLSMVGTVYDLESRQTVPPPDGVSAWPGAIAFSNQSGWAALSDSKGALLFSTGEKPWKKIGLLALEGSANSIAFSRDGRLVAVRSRPTTGGGEDTSGPSAVLSAIFEVATQKRLFDLEGTATFTSDGRWVMTTENEARILRDSSTGKALTNISKYGLVVPSPSGEALWLVRTHGGQERQIAINIQPLSNQDLIKQACSVLPRKFMTDQEWKDHLAGEPFKKTCQDKP